MGAGSFKPVVARSSEGTMLQHGETPLVQRIVELINWTVENGEGLQVLHYKPGGEYQPHY